MRAKKRVLATAAFALIVGTLPNISSAGSADPVQIEVLSNRADLVSGGDALVEIVVGDGIEFADVTIDVDGTDATAAFHETADGRFMGRLEGLVLGGNVVTATLPDAPALRSRSRTTRSTDRSSRVLT